jgi:Tfp pilus assembly protein PilN
VDPRQIDLASAEAREANALIDRRTLSWTELFNRFETTLPADVRITAVHPSVDRDRQMTLVVTVNAREVDDVDAFMQQLDATGVFLDVRSTEERRTEEGQIESTLEMAYVPQSAATTAPEAGATATAPAEAKRR